MELDTMLRDYLLELSAGERKNLGAALEILSGTVLFTPVVVSVDVGDNRGTKKIRVATQTTPAGKRLPVFTTEDLFFEWSNDDYQFIPVTGSDLALTLPADVGLVINPQTELEVEILPEDVALLTEQRQVEEPAVELNAPAHAEGIAAGSNKPSTEHKGDKSSRFSSKDYSDEQITDALSEIFRSYAEIKEGYFSRSRSELSEGLLGILSGKFTPERRFHLMSEIAELSRDLLGAAGALEVYDDLNVSNSNSWDLFSTLVPFYENPAALNFSPGSTPKIDAATYERAQVPTSAERPKHLPQDTPRARLLDELEVDHQQADETGEFTSAWDILRKKRDQLFTALRSGGRR